MKEKINEFLKTKDYKAIKDGFVEAMENGYGIHLGNMMAPAVVEENASKLCDTFVFNCITSMLGKDDPVNKLLGEIEYYKKWVPWIEKVSQAKDRSLQEELNRLEQIVYNCGNRVYEASSEDATEEKKAETVQYFVMVFVATVEFYLRLGLDPVEILSQSLFDCDMEEYGAMEHLNNEVVYKLDTSCKAAGFLASIEQTSPQTYENFIDALFEIWGTFNIFRAKSNMCSPKQFEDKLLQLLKKMSEKV